MPHDANNELLVEGDRVTVEAIVKSVQAGTEFCNVTLETVSPMPPYTTPSTLVLNTRQCKKLT